MKSSTHSTLSDRRALLAATMAVLLGATTAVAQSGSTSGTRSTTGSSGGSTYGSDSSATDSTSSRRDTGTSSSTSPGQTDTSRSSGAYGTGSTSGTSGTGSTTATGTTGSSTTSTDTAGGATTMTGRDASGKLGWMERRFVNKAADHGKTEIALAELATQQASNPEVKSFAQKLVDDHKKVDEELTSLAGQKNVKLDQDDDPKEERHYKRLAKKSGTEFDQEFVETMVDMHEADVKMFEKASTDAKDSALKSFAAKHVDHLRQHLQQAQSLRSTIMPTGRTDASSTSTSDTTGSSSTRSTDSTSGSAHQSSTSGTSGTTGTPGTTGGSSTNSGSGTGSSSSSSDTTPPRSNR